MDVCTLSTLGVVLAVGCLPAQECVVRDDGVKYCKSAPGSCKLPSPQYTWNCVKGDGSGVYSKPAQETDLGGLIHVERSR